jgi:hypothetical protein
VPPGCAFGGEVQPTSFHAFCSSLPFPPSNSPLRPACVHAPQLPGDGRADTVVVISGATALLALCKAVAATEPGPTGSENWCVGAQDAALTAEGCSFEGAPSGVLYSMGPTASATLTRCTLVRGGDVCPITVRVSEGAAAVLRGCQVSIEPRRFWGPNRPSAAHAATAATATGSGAGSGSSTDGSKEAVAALSVSGGASLVLEGGTRVDAAGRGGVEAVVEAVGAGSSLAERGGCSIVGGSHHTVDVFGGARAALDSSTFDGPATMHCVRAGGPGTSLAVRSCTVTGAKGRFERGRHAPYALCVDGGAKATVTATRAEGGRVGVVGEGSVLVHSGLACSGGVVASRGGTARELPARAGAGGGGGQGSGCAPPAAAGPSGATAPGGGQATAAGPGGASGEEPSAGGSGVGEAETEAATAGMAALSVAGTGASAGG